MERTTPLFKTLISTELSNRIERNPSYSLRAFARACGISAGAVSQILSGARLPSYNVAQKLIAALGVGPVEAEQLLSELARLHKQRGLKRVSRAFQATGSAPLPARELSLDLFRVIGDWSHYAILMLTFVEQFQSNPRWIACELNLSEMEVKLAIERLINVGLLDCRDGTLIATESHVTTADKHITNAALKRHVKQSLEKAIVSVENDLIDTRSMTYMTMAIDPDKIPEAKILIEEFTNRMSGLLESGRRRQVYEFGIYLYPLQKTKSGNRNQKGESK